MRSLLFFILYTVLATGTSLNTQLTDQFFSFSHAAPSTWLAPVGNTNVYAQIYSSIICGQVSLLGDSTSNLIQISSLFSSLLPHYQLSVSLYIYTIDTVTTSPDTQISISIDNSASTYQLSQSTASINTQLCNGSQNDLIWKFNATIPHTTNSLLLNVSIHNTTTNTYWGVRNLKISSFQLCHSTCLACTGPSEFDCTQCSVGSVAVDGSCPDVVVGNPVVPSAISGSNLTACDSEIEDASHLLLFVKNSTVFQTPANEIFVNTTIQVLYNKTTVSQSCKSILTTKILYEDPNHQIGTFPSQYVSFEPTTSTLTISFPLAQAQQFTSLIQASTQFSQTIYTLSLIFLAGNTQMLLRDHHFDLLLVLDGVSTLSFLFDSDPLQTQTYCNGNFNQTCQDATVADLDIEGSICQDTSCTQLFPQGQTITKIIGENLIVKLSFKDKSYTKSLQLNHVFMRADNLVLDLSQVSEVLLNDNAGSIIVSTLLTGPSSTALFQYNLNIGVSNARLRRLFSEETLLAQSPQSYQAHIILAQPNPLELQKNEATALIFCSFIGTIVFIGSFILM